MEMVKKELNLESVLKELIRIFLGEDVEYEREETTAGLSLNNQKGGATWSSARDRELGAPSRLIKPEAPTEHRR